MQGPSTFHCSVLLNVSWLSCELKAPLLRMFHSNTLRPPSTNWLLPSNPPPLKYFKAQMHSYANKKYDKKYWSNVVIGFLCMLLPYNYELRSDQIN